MSNWTHVAGIIRVDCLRPLGDTFDPSVFGKEVRFDDSDDTWREYSEHPERFLPGGSEGSLHISVWENPEPSSAAAYAVSIFGDLRDHDSPQEIVDWFKSKCAELYVRNAVITVSNERNGDITYTYSEDES